MTSQEYLTKAEYLCTDSLNPSNPGQPQNFPLPKPLQHQHDIGQACAKTWNSMLFSHSIHPWSEVTKPGNNLGQGRTCKARIPKHATHFLLSNIAMQGICKEEPTVLHSHAVTMLASHVACYTLIALAYSFVHTHMHVHRKRLYARLQCPVTHTGLWKCMQGPMHELLVSQGQY